MKKVLTLFALVIALNSFGQTIDTSIHDCTCSAVNNSVFRHGFPVVADTVTRIGFFNYTDAPKDSTCVVNYVVKANSINQNVLFSQYTLTKSEYYSWNSDIQLIIIIRNYLQQSGLNLSFK